LRLAAMGGGDAVLFSFSDRPAQQALGLWRERQG
jgi:gentisate 1,2-dioxygenase